jgi:hypothetical protein
MRTTQVLVLLSALGLASAGLKADAAAQTPVPAPSGAVITVTLKDGQTAQLLLKSYDNFFLTAFNAKGTRFDLPWSDIAAVDSSQENGADLALMRGKITDEPAQVDLVVEPRLPGTALARSLWPGILVHGAGFDYAGDKSSFYDLVGAESFGVVLAAIGAYQLAYPNTEDTNKTAADDLTIAGAAVFVVSWLWDIAFSPGAAAALDANKGLALAPALQGRGAQLAYNF